MNTFFIFICQLSTGFVLITIECVSVFSRTSPAWLQICLHSTFGVHLKFLPLLVVFYRGNWPLML